MWDLNFLKMMCSAALWLVFLSPSAWAEEALEARVIALEQELSVLRALVTALAPKAALESQLTVETKVLPVPSDTAAKVADVSQGFSYQGFIQLDSLLSRYSDGKPGGGAIDDFLIPVDIPVRPDAIDNFTSANMSAKTSRFGFATDHMTDAGRIKSLVELDFALSAQGNERISNSWSSRIRHAYVDWQWSEKSGLVAGQTWTTFMRAEARPALWDMTGAVGQAFNRQPLIRWRYGDWSFAAENPATRLDGVSYEQAQEALPDLIARYDGQVGGLGWTMSGMVRQLNYREARVDEPAVEDDALGYAASFAGNWQYQGNDFSFMFNYGDALGRYMGLNAFSDGVVTQSGEIETYEQIGGLVSWNRRLNRHWQTGVTLSAAWADVPSEDIYAAAGLLPEHYASGHFSLWYRPTGSLSLGSEYIRAIKQLENGDSGSLDRLMFSVRYKLK